MENNAFIFYSFIGLALDLRGMTWNQLCEGSGIPYSKLMNYKSQGIGLSPTEQFYIMDGATVDYEDYLNYVQYLKDSGLHSIIAFND